MQQYLLPAFLFAVGLVIIVKGGDFFVDAARWISDVTGIPRFIVGATVVSLATMLPELLVSIIATAEHSVDMAVGNAIGSVISNLGLIMAISILFIPGRVDGESFFSKALLMVGSTVLLLLCGLDNTISVMESLLLLAVLVIFILVNIQSIRNNPSEMQLELRSSEHGKFTGKEITANLIKFGIGAAGILLGAHLLVDNGRAIARMMGIPEMIIGLTMVAIGTSLPELATTISAIVKKESALSIGNILGANVIDITLILPICAMIHGGHLPISPQTSRLDAPVALLLMATAVMVPLIIGRFRRWQGIFMLLIYGVYIYTITMVHG